MKIKDVIKKIIPPLFIDIYRMFRKSSASREVYRTAKISGFSLKVLYNSSIDRFIESVPLYSRNMSRLVVFIEKHFPHTAVIDVGANVGDTAALVRGVSNIQMLCIEGENLFFDCLEENIKQFKGIETIHNYLGEEDSTSGFKKVGTDTSLSLETSDSETLEIQKLDTCLKYKYKFIGAKVLKIDTDGFEMKVLRGSVNYIRKTRPVLFLEYSPPHYQLAGEKPLALFDLLASLGYKHMLMYDHKGVLVMYVSFNGMQQIFSLCDYICQRDASIPYFDLAVFHETDQDLYSAFLQEEKQFYKQFDMLLTRERENNVAGS